MRTLGGGRFTVAYVTHALTTADLGEAGREPLRDEQSRTLLMMSAWCAQAPPPRHRNSPIWTVRSGWPDRLPTLPGREEEAFRALASRAVPVDWPVAAAAATPAQDRKVGRAGVAAATNAQDRNLGRRRRAAAANAQARWLGRPASRRRWSCWSRSSVGSSCARAVEQPCAPATAVVVASPAPATCAPTTGRRGHKSRPSHEPAGALAVESLLCCQGRNARALGRGVFGSRAKGDDPPGGCSTGLRCAGRAAP